MPRLFLDAAPNSRDRLLSLNIVASAPEVNARDEVVEGVEVVTGVEVTRALQDLGIFSSR